MQIVCPTCGEPISSEHINIQRMAAVCPACHTVFQFDPSPSKLKRRKIKQPAQLLAQESENGLKLAFRTNFLLYKNELFLAGVFFSSIFTFLTLMLAVAANSPAKMLLALMFGLISCLLYYGMALVAYNKTHIDISDESITVSRKPLLDFFNPTNTILLSGIESIRYEETAASKEAGYDTPRYTVWAEMVEGHRKVIANNLIEDYAVFITQRLNEQLEANTAPDVSRLTDHEQDESDYDTDALIAYTQRRKGEA